MVLPITGASTIHARGDGAAASNALINAIMAPKQLDQIGDAGALAHSLLARPITQQL